jgi:hypothetical protein
VQTALRLLVGQGSTVKIEASKRRQHRRRRMLKTGIIAYNNGTSTINCQVRNLSEMGAHLLVYRAMDVPDKFDLLIPLDGFLVPCEVIWKKTSEVGVAFLAVPRSVAPKQPSDQAIGCRASSVASTEPDKR